MSFWALSLCLTFIWLVIHVLNKFLLIRSRDLSLLPTASFGSRIPTTRIFLKKLHLRVQTTAWNRHHEKLAARLAGKQSLKAKTLLAGFYDAGSALGLLGMIGAIGLLLWTTRDIALSLHENLTHDSDRHDVFNAALRSMKRALGTPQTSQPESMGRPDSLLKPIVSYHSVYDVPGMGSIF